MTELLDLRTPGFMFWFSPAGQELTFAFTFPDGYASGKTFTAKFDRADETELDLEVVDDVVTVTASHEVLAAHPSRNVELVLFEGGRDRIIATGTPSERASVTTTHELTVTDGTISVPVTVLGPAATITFGPDGELNGTTPEPGDVVTWDGDTAIWSAP